MEFTQEDRDMLKAHDIKLGIICERMDDLDDTMQDGFQRILDKMEIQKDFCSTHREKISNAYFTKRVLMWLIGAIVLGLVGIGTYTGDLSSKVQLNTHRINTLHGSK